jgi:hypothetical protein
MKYDKIEKYFQEGETGVTQLLVDCKDAFDTIEEYKGLLIANIITDIDSYKEALNRITGLYGFFEPIFNLAQAYKEIKEDEAYSNLRVQAETEGKKLTADALKVEAHKAVSLFIRTRNIFESYVNITEKFIITIQSQLNRFEKNYNNKPQEER